MDTHKVQFTFEGEPGFTVECREDEDVVTAALRCGYILLTECREGVCSTCKGVLVDGDYDELLPHSVHALSPSEEEEGYVLACRLQPCSDLVIDYDYPVERVERFAEGVRNGQIVALERCSATVMRLVVRTLGVQPTIDFEAGQYVRLTLPARGVTRAYSMASVASEDRELEFLVRILPDGAFSGYLADEAEVGEMVVVEGPFGRFGLRAGTELSPVFVAGGTGLAPMMAMLRTLARTAPEAPATLFFGNTDAADVFFERELADLAAGFPGLTVHHSLARPGPGWEGHVGFVTDAVRDHVGDPLNHAYYLCGPPPMIGAARELLAGWRVPNTQIHEETFIPSGSQGDGEG